MANTSPLATQYDAQNTGKTDTQHKAQTVLQVWFDPKTQPLWFAKDADFDARLTAQFLPTLKAAMHGELYMWRDSARGRLAEIIVLDQFSRNIYRDTPQAFAQDGMALVLAQALVQQSDFATLKQAERNFALMPFMHAESLAIHAAAQPLFDQYADASTQDYEHKHRAIIARFGRYPHRNAVLGRTSSAQELEFLQQPDSSF